MATPLPARRLLAATITVGSLTVVRTLAGLVRTKYIATTLGAFGAGLIAQGAQLQLLFTTIGSLSLSVGIINSVSKSLAVDDEQQRQRILATAFVIHVAGAAAVVTTAALFARPLSNLIFGNPDRIGLLLPMIVSAPFAILASSYVEGIFFGYGRYDLYTKASMLATIGGLGTFVLLSSLFGITGALWGMAANSMLLLGFFLAKLRQILPLGEALRFGWRVGVARSLFGFSVSMLVAGAAGYASLLLIRSFLVSTLGVGANGVYQVPIAFTAYYTPLLTNGLWAHLHPTVSGDTDTHGRGEELATALMFAIVFSTTAVLLLTSLQEIAIRAVYSPEFLPATQILPIQMVGDPFFFVLFTCGVFLLGVGQLRLYTGLMLFHYLLYVGFSLLTIPTLGVRGAALGYAFASAGGAGAAILFVVVRWAPHRMRRLLRLLILSGLATMAQAGITLNVSAAWVRVIVPTCWAAGILYLEGSALKEVVRTSFEAIARRFSGRSTE